MIKKQKRENWGSKLGIILAVAGSAVGLGNFLRFPVQAANNGGGAFMIPYFISLLLIGIPMMWVEWTIGRYGGAHGHTTAPGMFHRLWNNRLGKYFGVIGVFGPLVIFIYYIYIESWLLGYSFYSLSGVLSDIPDKESMAKFLSAYQGLESGGRFGGLLPAFFFFIITIGLNFFVLFRGVSRGIERLCKAAMPLLFLAALALLIRVVTLAPPYPDKPDWSVLNGFGYLWNPDFSALLDAKTWLAAAGQVFFTLSVGIGVILTYASYLRRNDDIALSGLTAASTNEFTEIVLGGSIVIPLAFAFFGPDGMREIASSGAFNLSFVTMPFIFSKISLGAFFSFLWFFLLFLAGLTSSISLIEPMVAFIRDNFRMKRKKAVVIVGVLVFFLCQPAIFFLGHGVVDELDFWGGTFCLVLFGTIESILFAWAFGINRAWDEMHLGAQIKIPRVYKWIIKYVTPPLLLVILGTWIVQQGWDTIIMKHVRAEDVPYILFTRLGLVCMFLVLAVLVYIWHKKSFGGGEK
ncbi:MAG: sodium-dependent transporter [Syntrophales bacterium]|jgi:SNF family Na+-dependent transporter|nr:sodium-dependent transporter [Syntrophales bacterium]